MGNLNHDNGLEDKGSGRMRGPVRGTVGMARTRSAKPGRSRQSRPAGDAVLEAVCSLLAERETLHYHVLGGTDRIRFMSFPGPLAGAAGAQALEMPIADFWDALGAPDLAMRLGWHESAGAGSPSSAAFTYAIERPSGERLTIEDRAWRLPGKRGARRETHGVLHALGEGRRQKAAKLDPGALAVQRALEGGEFSVAYQPVVDSVSGRIGFHECLARLRDEDGVLHAAAAFMPRVEAAGLVATVDRQMLRAAFTALAEHPSARLSINIDPSTIADAEWRRIFDDCAAAHPCAADRLIVEITERGAMEDIVATREFIDHVRCHGAALALDDFGEGQTSFRQLRDFRFDIVKIAGGYIRDVITDPDARFFVETLVDIARHFEMMTVAEYVQTAAAARILAGLGVDSFQGFFFGRPSLVLEPSETIEFRLASS